MESQRESPGRPYRGYMHMFCTQIGRDECDGLGNLGTWSLGKWKLQIRSSIEGYAHTHRHKWTVLCGATATAD